MGISLCLDGTAGCPPYRAVRAEHFSLLRSFPLFAQLSQEVMTGVLEDASVVDFAADTVVFREGQVPDYLHVVMHGEIGLIGLDECSEYTVVEILRPGSVFIEAAVMTSQPYLMGAKALRATTLLQLPARKVRDDVAGTPALAAAMLTSLSAHFRLMITEIKDLKLKTASQRLALYLLELSGTTEGPARVLLPHSKGVIAARIGIRPETLSRALNTLKCLGVAVKGPRISISDLSRLHQFCAE